MSLPLSKRYRLSGLMLIACLILLAMLLKVLQREGALSISLNKVKGPINAPIQVQEFSDFQCPSCQKATQVMHDVFKSYPGKIRLTFHHFPLKMHKWASLAHQAAECAAGQGKFWPYHDLLFERQGDWSKMQDPKIAFKQYAQELGLDGFRFTACLDQNQTQNIVLEDVQSGQARQVSATPTFFIGDRRIVGGKLFADQINQVIQELLRKK